MQKSNSFGGISNIISLNAPPTRNISRFLKLLFFKISTNSLSSGVMKLYIALSIFIAIDIVCIININLISINV